MSHGQPDLGGRGRPSRVTTCESPALGAFDRCLNIGIAAAVFGVLTLRRAFGAAGAPRGPLDPRRERDRATR
jgi:hypothetical protein